MFWENNLKRIMFFISLLVLFGIYSQVCISAQITLGVKKGDWIEYNLNYSGSAPSEYPKWIKIDVLNVEGTNITAKLTLLRIDGTTQTVNGTYDLETGVLDLLLIPANLDLGDDFFHADFGNVLIDGIEEYTYCDANRIVNHATIEGIECHWDKITGILLQSEHSTDDFNQKMVADKTNMWEAQIFGLDSIIFYILILVILVIIAIVVVIVLKKR
jgi:hypothetical protein